jgi:hypothetical protein
VERQQSGHVLSAGRVDALEAQCPIRAAHADLQLQVAADVDPIVFDETSGHPQEAQKAAEE